MASVSKIKFGVLGASHVALKSVLPAMRASNLAEFVMIGSRNPEKAKEVAGEFGASKRGSYEDVLKNDDIDAVYISLPNALHEEWSIKSVEAGKHVVCEKPAAISYGAAKRMAEAAKKNKVRIMEGLMFRYHPQHAKVKEFMANGMLGEIIRFDSCFSIPSSGSGINLLNKGLGGGSLNYQGPYPIYASRMIFGEEPESILCRMKIDSKSGVDTMADMILYYPGGKTAFASTICGSYFQSTYDILGTKGYLKMGRAYAVPRDMGTKIFLDTNDKIEEISVVPADHFKLMFDDFCEEVLKGRKSEEDFEGDLLAQARVLEAAKKSAEEKRLVDISEIK